MSNWLSVKAWHWDVKPAKNGPQGVTVMDLQGRNETVQAKTTTQNLPNALVAALFFATRSTLKRTVFDSGRH